MKFLRSCKGKELLSKCCWDGQLGKDLDKPYADTFELLCDLCDVFSSKRYLFISALDFTISDREFAFCPLSAVQPRTPSLRLDSRDRPLDR